MDSIQKVRISFHDATNNNVRGTRFSSLQRPLSHSINFSSMFLVYEDACQPLVHDAIDLLIIAFRLSFPLAYLLSSKPPKI